MVRHTDMEMTVIKEVYTQRSLETEGMSCRATYGNTRINQEAVGGEGRVQILCGNSHKKEWVTHGKCSE